MRIGIFMVLVLTTGVPIPAAEKRTELAEVLHAEAASSDRADALALYGQFVGAWEVDVVDYPPDEPPRRSKGEWHFGWVLEGRAIQDVFIVPRRAERRTGEPAKPGNRYGTTIRTYDPEAGVWNITWINPVTGVRNLLVGRKQGDAIVQEGRDTDGALMRWSFSDITKVSFRWRGEESTDDGKTWRLGAEFFARRTTLGSFTRPHDLPSE